ncbi:MAG: CRISPR-associated endonuclease Cas1 [Candidatus Bathyarchaeota archaeon]|nr:CRISPR-associated endonuclease Cas1 [Candidatus Bathyarchaeota archaeon]
MGKVRAEKIVLDSHGSYLGMEKGCFAVRDKRGEVQRFPLFENEIGEVVLKSGNAVSTGALASMGFWGIDVLVLTQRGKPVAMLKSFEDDSHVETRLCQYEVFNNGKGVQIAKQFVLSKIEGQNRVLEKHNLKIHSPISKQKIEKIQSENLKDIRRKLMTIEGNFTRQYFGQIFRLFPKKLKPRMRKTFKAYDGVNNTFNLAYEILSWKVHKALVKARLEPFLGFLHSVQYGKPSLVCDFMELYRYLIDDFLIQYLQKLKRSDFIVKSEMLSRKRQGKREYLNCCQTRDLMKQLHGFFERKVDVPRVRIGNRQSVETLISEEALLFAKYIRGEKATWIPRVAVLN